MELEFYRERFRQLHGIEVLVPERRDRDEVNRVIYEELVFRDLRDASRARYVEICARLAERGAGAVVLGCTEITLLLKPDDLSMPMFDSTGLHALAAVREALKAD
jgi:aspartate racemase